MNFTGAVLGGVGKRAQQAAIVLAASYGVSLPVAFYLCLVADWGLRGLWTGLSIGLLISSSAEWIYVLVCIDWEKESVKAVARAAEERQKGGAGAGAGSSGAGDADGGGGKGGSVYDA